jgi:hypothetical protein
MNEDKKVAVDVDVGEVTEHDWSRETRSPLSAAVEPSCEQGTYICDKTVRLISTIGDLLLIRTSKESVMDDMELDSGSCF